MSISFFKNTFVAESWHHCYRRPVPKSGFFNAENYSIEYILIVQVDLSHEQFFKSIRANNCRANNEGSLGGRIVYMPMHSTTQASVCVSIGRQKTIKYALYTA